MGGRRTRQRGMRGRRRTQERKKERCRKTLEYNMERKIPGPPHTAISAHSAAGIVAFDTGYAQDRSLSAIVTHRVQQGELILTRQTKGRDKRQRHSHNQRIRLQQHVKTFQARTTRAAYVARQDNPAFKNYRGTWQGYFKRLLPRMEYETPDGSRFYLQEIFGDEASGHAFKYTSITAFVDGKPYAARSEHPLDDVDYVDLLDMIQPVPLENINPQCPEGFLRATSPSLEEHYLKAPFFMYEDSKPGRTFIADCLLNEATALEKLRHHPHPNLVEYLGCVVNEDRITQLCLKRYEGNLQDHTLPLSDQQREDIFAGVISAVKHLHRLGLAHNDIGPQNICLDSVGHPVIVDFDACIPFGEELLKGVGAEKWGGRLVSDPENDFQGLDDLKDWLDDYDAER